MTTKIYPTTRETFIAFRAFIKQTQEAKQITTQDLYLYNLVRGKDVSSGFTPISNTVKLANGQSPSFAISQTRRALLRAKRSIDDNKSWDRFYGEAFVTRYGKELAVALAQLIN